MLPLIIMHTCSSCNVINGHICTIVPPRVSPNHHNTTTFAFTIIQCVEVSSICFLYVSASIFLSHLTVLHVTWQLMICFCRFHHIVLHYLTEECIDRDLSKATMFAMRTYKYVMCYKVSHPS